MAMKNKRGWLRILEAVISIMIISSVLLIVYSGQSQAPDISDRVYVLQKEVLADITLNSVLRENALESNVGALTRYADIKIPPAFNFSLKICDLEAVGICKMTTEEIRETRDKNVFVEEIILSSNLGTYDPKKVRLFIWEVD
jgi:hypothetical protein